MIWQIAALPAPCVLQPLTILRVHGKYLLGGCIGQTKGYDDKRFSRIVCLSERACVNKELRRCG